MWVLKYNVSGYLLFLGFDWIASQFMYVAINNKIFFPDILF